MSKQGAVSYTVNHDGSSAVGAKVPIAGSDTNTISLTGGHTSIGAVSKGLVLENTGGHSLSVSQTTIPDFGSQVTGTGRVNLFNNDNHRVDANASITKNMPNIPNVPVPNFNTVGGGVDYTFKNTVGASLGVAQTPFLQRTDYSAMGKLNLLQSPQSSLDLSAGFSKTVAPQMNTNWQPAGALTFTKFFNFGR